MSAASASASAERAKAAAATADCLLLCSPSRPHALPPQPSMRPRSVPERLLSGPLDPNACFFRWKKAVLFTSASRMIRDPPPLRARSLFAHSILFSPLRPQSPPRKIKNKKQFVADGVFYAELNELLTRELAEQVGCFGRRERKRERERTRAAGGEKRILPADREIISRRLARGGAPPPPLKNKKNPHLFFLSLFSL